MIKQNVSLKALNTLALPAMANFYAYVTSLEEIEQALLFAKQKDLAILVLGGGSNCVFTEDFQGLVLHIGIKGIDCLKETENEVLLRVGGGEIWDEFLQYCLNKAYYGLENLAIIPGTVGAAPVQNIGAYGVEVADCLVQVEAIDRQTGQVVQLAKAQCQLSYRDSVFKQQAGRYIVFAVQFCLKKHFVANLSYQALADRMANGVIDGKSLREAVVAIRTERLPDPKLLPNVGSFFKNPIIKQAQFAELKQRFPALPSFNYHDDVKVPAAWLIDYCGFKGQRFGAVGVHENQALVLVNYADAEFSDIKYLVTQIVARVWAVFAIQLEPEPVFVSNE